MEAPQVLVIIIYAMVIGGGIIGHGQPRKGNSNVLYDLIGVAIICSLLYWGGFWGGN